MPPSKVDGSERGSHRTLQNARMLLVPVLKCAATRRKSGAIPVGPLLLSPATPPLYEYTAWVPSIRYCASITFFAGFKPFTPTATIFESGTTLI